MDFGLRRTGPARRTVLCFVRFFPGSEKGSHAPSLLLPSTKALAFAGGRRARYKSELFLYKAKRANLTVARRGSPPIRSRSGHAWPAYSYSCQNTVKIVMRMEFLPARQYGTEDQRPPKYFPSTSASLNFILTLTASVSVTSAYYSAVSSFCRRRRVSSSAFTEPPVRQRGGYMTHHQLCPAAAPILMFTAV